MFTSTQTRRLRCALVVDDDPSVRDLIQKILESSALLVLVARTGPQAMELLEHYKVDVLVTDIALSGMTAVELTERARRQYPGLPVCCIAGSLPEGAKVPEHVSLVAKPFHPHELLHSVEAALQPAEQSPNSRADAAHAV